MPHQYEAPNWNKDAFHCPHCGSYSHMEWTFQTYQWASCHVGSNGVFSGSAFCARCKKQSVWLSKQMVYPNRGSAPPPHPDMPGDVREDYEEATRVAGVSPRAAAALLRLAVQRLMPHIGGTGKNIDADIKALVAAKKINPMVQQALDVARVTGNEAVHPGQIDTDDPEVVGGLFKILNAIVEAQIAVPKQIEAAYAALPQANREAIAKRDGQGAPVAKGG